MAYNLSFPRRFYLHTANQVVFYDKRIKDVVCTIGGRMRWVKLQAMKIPESKAYIKLDCGCCYEFTFTTATEDYSNEKLTHCCKAHKGVS